MEQITRREVLKRIEQCEREGKFDEHTDPIDWDNTLPVDKNYVYLRKGLKNFLQNQFIVKPFTHKIATKEFHTKVVGKENLVGLKSAIFTCNHINKFDCLVIKYALRGHKLRITAGDFNNQKGWFGEMMRVGGLMPFSSNFSAMSNFNKAMDYLIAHNYFVMFYPEQAMWWNYKKPRPYKDGAFHYATKYSIPVVPMFITMEDSGKFDDENLPKKNYTIHILKPIYPRAELERKQNIEYLKNNAFDACKTIYETTYNTKLVYSCDEN